MFARQIYPAAVIIIFARCLKFLNYRVLERNTRTMYTNWCSEIAFKYSGSSDIELPYDKDISEDVIRSALPFVFNSLDDSESEWQDLRTTWDVESVKIVHVDEENGLLPVAYRIIVSFHSYYKPYTVLLKVRNADAFIDEEKNENKNEVSKLMPYRELHERELKFYSNISRQVNIPIPEVYYMQEWNVETGQDGVIVMQDLIREGTRQNFYNGFTVAQMKTILKQVAHFHGSVLYDDLKGSILAKFPPLKSSIRELSKEDLLDNLLKTGSDFFKKNSESITRFINSVNLYQDKHDDMERTLVHGSLWTANVKFKKSWMGDACTDIRAIINWQHCHAGSPVEDVARLIVSSTNANIRRKHTDEFLEVYYDELKQVANLYDVSVPYSLGQIRAKYEEIFAKEVLFLLVSHVKFLVVPRYYERATDIQKSKLMNRMEYATEEVLSGRQFST